MIPDSTHRRPGQFYCATTAKYARLWLWLFRGPYGVDPGEFQPNLPREFLCLESSNPLTCSVLLHKRVQSASARVNIVQTVQPEPSVARERHRKEGSARVKRPHRHATSRTMGCVARPQCRLRTTGQSGKPLSLPRLAYCTIAGLLWCGAEVSVVGYRRRTPWPYSFHTASCM